MIPAPLAGHHLKATACVSGGGTSAAEMDKGGKILRLLRVRDKTARPGEDGSHIAVEVYRCQLNGMTRDCANIGSEAAARILDSLRSDAEPRNLGIGRIGHLEEANSAGCGPVDRERIEAEPPAPIGAVDRIARAFDLRQRGQQFGRDRMGRIGAEQRPVLPPRLGGLLVELVADKEEQLGRLVDHVIDEVCHRKSDEHDRDDAHNPNGSRRFRKRSSCPPPAAPPAAKDEALAYF